MKTNLIGRVEKLFLKQSQWFFPVFEAISNAAESIKEAKQTKGRIRVTIERSETQQAIPSNDKEKGIDNRYAQPVQNIIIEDNGAGFTQRNWESFQELDTMYKKDLGCKGIGRLYWLVVFESVEIESYYSEQGKNYCRKILFSLPNGEQGSEPEVIEGPGFQQKTIVRLLGVKPKYAEHYKKKSQTLYLELVKHFLPLFLLDKTLTLVLSDTGDIEQKLDPFISHEHLFNSNGSSLKIHNASINHESFNIYHLKTNLVEVKQHTINFCAGNRVVKEEKLLDYIPFSSKKIQSESDDKKCFYVCYITSPVLDSKVNSERTAFNIEDDFELDQNNNVLTWKVLREGLTEPIKNFLESDISQLEQKKEETIRSVLNELPAYTYILKNDPDFVQSVTYDESKEQIEAKLAVTHVKNQLQTPKKIDEILHKIEDEDIQDLNDFEKYYKEKIEPIITIHTADLVSYVSYRKYILEVYDKLISKKADDRFHLESVVHNIVFPRFHDDTENASSYENHNLWLIDDRLAFYDYLASDKMIKSHQTLSENGDGTRPDIVGYYKNLAFVEDKDRDEHAYDSIVIVEFKRPGREKYDEEDPIAQVRKYVKSISENSQRDHSGQEILTRKEATRYYVYIVCDINNDAIKECANYSQLKKTLDGGGFFGNIDIHGVTAYIEMISFKKLLKDAEKRNNIFFKKLGLKRIGAC